MLSIDSPLTSALDSKFVIKSKKVFVALIGHDTLSPVALYFLATECLPIPPRYVVKGIASLYSNTFSKYCLAFFSPLPNIAWAISRQCL